MFRKEGIHFYINIMNYNDVIEIEERKTGNVTHSIHALDTYFSSVERYASGICENLTIEKITGSRLHMYVEKNEISKAFEDVWRISVYARSLSKYMSENIAKYQSLDKFHIQIGASFGDFYEFIFKKDSLEELTTIGYAANFAAKLQNLTKENHLSISQNIYNSLKKEDIKSQFKRVDCKKIQKYGQSFYYEILLKESNKHFNEKRFTDVLEIANKVNLGDIHFSEARDLISFDNLSMREVKKLHGIPLFADVRGFTTLFDKDDSNLKEMANKTTQILSSMHNIVIKNKGTHIQFQGDREVALFHDYSSYSCCKDAILAGLRLIDSVENFGVSIGIGESYGKLYATRIGARGHKDNLLIGKVVNLADSLEDDCAKEKELVISKELYDLININNKNLSSIFKFRDGYYVTTWGYKKYLEKTSYEHLEKNNEKKNYNGAWRFQ